MPGVGFPFYQIHRYNSSLDRQEPMLQPQEHNLLPHLPYLMLPEEYYDRSFLVTTGM